MSDIGGQRLGQRLHAGLGRGRRRKGHEAARERVRHEGRHADQPPVRAALSSQGLAAVAEPKKAEVMAASEIPGGAIDLADQPPIGEARVADDGIDMAEARHRLLDQPRRGAGLGEVALDDQRLRARRADGLRHSLRAAAVLAGMDRDGGFGSGDGTRHGGADAG